jgi:hypothetical protein
VSAAQGLARERRAVHDAAMSRSGDSRLSLWSTDSFLSIGCRGSALSVGSVGSIASIASAGSFGSVLSVGSALSVGSGLSWLSLWSLLSERSIGGVLASRHRRAVTSKLLLAAGLLTVDRRLRGRSCSRRGRWHAQAGRKST